MLFRPLLRGLRAGGLRNVQARVIPNSGHFTSDEQPEALLAALQEFMGLLSETATSHERIA